MGSEKLAFRMRELEEALECGDRITSEASKILSECAQTLGAFSQRTAPIRDRARTLTTASRNIGLARERCDQIATSLDMSRRLQGTIQRGPSYDMDGFLAAVDKLEAAVSILWSNQQLSSVKEALGHAEQLWKGAMSACESDYAVTLTRASRPLSMEVIAGAVEKGEIEVVDPSAIPRLKVMTGAMSKEAQSPSIRVYTDLRTEDMERMLKEIGLQTPAFPELQSMTLEQLETKIRRWIDLVSALVILLSAEKSVILQIFSDASTNGIFSHVIAVVLERVGGFGRDILRTSHPPQKLFSLLEMHHALENILIDLEAVIMGTPCTAHLQDLKDLLKEIETAAGTLFDIFQNSVKEDSNKRVLTFFKRLFKHGNFMKVIYGSTATSAGASQFQIGNHMSSSMVRILMILQENLEAKSRGYKNKALANLFLMNNINFMVTSVEQSKALELLGQPWVERQKTVVQDYADAYHSITWEALIKAMDVEADDVTLGNFQRRKSAIKERFKTFNNGLEETHATQREWIIPDPDLKGRVRERILQTVVPAYTRFHAAFQNANFTKNPEKYLKHQAADVQRLIEEDLFENKVQSKEPRRLVL